MAASSVRGVLNYGHRRLHRCHEFDFIAFALMNVNVC